jgi:hypothetical protein
LNPLDGNARQKKLNGKRVAEAVRMAVTHFRELK